MNVKCVNKKEFKNLTLNKDYDATEDGEVYVVTNDAGLPARYAKKYFTTVVVQPRSTPIAEALRVDIEPFDDDETEITVELTIGRHRAVTVTLEVMNTNVSCGVEELSGISRLKTECTNLYDRLDHTLYTGTKEDLFRAVITPMMETLIEAVKGCYIMSDAIRDREDGYNAILNELSNTRWTGLNGNSGNDIILWIFS